MKTLRHILRGPVGRALTGALVVATIHAFIEPDTYLYALEVQRQKEADIRAIAAKMNVDPEFLLHPQGRTRFDFRTLFRQLGERLGLQSQAVTTNDAQPPDIRESIKRVKDRYALVAADTTLARVAQLVQLSLAPENVQGKKKGQIRAELQSVLRLIDKDFLPAVKDNAPGIAKSRDTDMRKEIKALQTRLKPVLNAPHAFDDANLEATLAQLRAAVSGTITVRNSKPRWTRDPFPVKDTYRTAPSKPAGPRYGDDPGGASAPTPAVVAQSVAAPRPALRPVSNAVPGEVAALANSLGTPAKIFAWVHDHVDWESYSGVAKGSLGALKEGRGNDWDQALLLRDLLVARGYDARLEWGRVTLPMAKAMNLVGTEDPLQAANLLATAGFDGLVLTAQSQPIAIQMTHVWVRANIPYIPNRGATAGSPDTWVRMDPSFKRYEYQAGIAINGKVAWSEDEYLQTSTIRPPAEFYGDKIWNYIRTNNIDCINLSQVTKAGRIKAANFPFVPATLTTRIESVGGFAAGAPSEQMQSVTMNVTDINGAVMASYTTSLADVWGRKLSITFPPATPEDAATIAAYGGLFNTPAYLIKLKPVFSLDDQLVADGSPVPAGAVLDLNTTFRQPNVADDFTHHELVAGETHALVLDPGAFPDSLIEARINRLKTLTAEDAILSEKLYLVGLRYMQHVDDGIAFSTGVRWQRPVKRVFEADVRRQIDITYNVAGAAVRLTPAENNIDVSRLLVGIVPINNDLSNREPALALAGLQSSYLEGAIWEEMESQQGISAAKALLLARMAGQQIHTVNAANVNAVLASVNLSADVEAEIRGAVAQGRIAKIPSANLQVNRWNGTGYILQDPQTGAATYPISGGLAGGSSTGELIGGIQALLGYEQWIQGSPFAQILTQILGAFGGGGSGGGNTPSTTQSDPVNLSSGNMYKIMADASVATRGIPVALMRTYNSRSTYNGPFGYGWTWSYGEMLVPNADGSVTYRESDGTEHLFTKNGSLYVSPVGKHLDLLGDASGWTLTFKDGLRFGFDSRGLLVTQRDLNGNQVVVNHDANGLPTTIVDAAGRTVFTFAVTGGKIVGATDIAGRTTSYAYSGDDLLTVIDTAGKTWAMEYDLAHNMTGFADPLGNAQSFDYDTDDRLFHHVDAVGAEEFFHYDLGGRQSVVTDRRGGERLIKFDDRGRATLEADPAGNVVSASFDAENNRIGVVDSRGNQSTYEYDAAGNATRQVNADGGVATATYDSHSRAITTTDAAGITTTNTYDSAGNVLASSRVVAGVTETTTYAYSAAGQMLSMTDPTGGTTSMTYHANGTIATRTDAASNITTMASDALGRITGITDAAGGTQTLSYDGKDRVTNMTDPQNNVMSFVYDSAGRRTSVTTPRGTTQYSYDAEGRIVATTDGAGNINRTTYDAAGDVLTRTDPRGNTVRYEYDQVGRVTRMIDASGGVWTYGYCASVGGTSCSTCGAGGVNYCELTDPNGKVIKREFDSMGRVIRVVDSLGHVSLTSYDRLGRKLAETDANGNTTSYTYDPAGRLTSVTEAGGAVTRFTYDKAGRKLTQKDAAGNVWSFKYDSSGRLIEESDPLDRKTTYTFDTVGNMKTRTDAKGQTTTYTYSAGRLMSVTFADGTAESFTYDAAGRRTSMSSPAASVEYAYDAAGRIKSTKNVKYGNTVIGYEYDAAGNRIAMTTPKGRTAYTYDAKNRLTTIADPTLGAFRFTYDAMDRRTELRYPNGITTSYDYDNAYRLKAMVSRNAGGIVLDAWSYQYDAVGNRTAVTDVAGKSNTFRYDQVDRLTEANYGNGSGEKFTYDLVGNRKTMTTEAGVVTTYSYDVANQLQSAGGDTFLYDANGNLTSKTTAAGTTAFTYDAANRLSRVSGPSGTETSAYAPNGRRSQIASPAVEGTIQPEYDLTGNPILDMDSNGGRVWIYRVYGPGTDEVLGEWRLGNGRTAYLLHDALGSVTAMTATDGRVMARYSFRAFGAETRTDSEGGASPPSRVSFTGRERSVGELLQYRSRYYDTNTGRFTQQDTFRGREMVPPSLHRYTYAHNNPVRYVDPSGHSVLPVNPWLATVAAIAGAMALSAAFAVAVLLTFAIIDNSMLATDGWNFALGTLTNIVGFAAALFIIEYGWIGIIGVGLGLAAISSANVLIVMVGSGYTVCEKVTAFLTFLMGMVVAMFAVAMGAIFSLAADAGYITAGIAFVLTAIFMLARTGFVNLMMNPMFLENLDRPLSERLAECRA